MKPTTKRNSSSVPSKKKQLLRTLTGLIFWPKQRPEDLFIGVLAWTEGGKPDNAIIYDTLDNLISCNVPVCDAISYRGIYQRLPKLRKPPERNITLSKIIVVKTHPPKVVKTVDGIFAADKKDHHVLKY